MKNAIIIDFLAYQKKVIRFPGRPHQNEKFFPVEKDLATAIRTLIQALRASSRFNRYFNLPKDGTYQSKRSETNQA